MKIRVGFGFDVHQLVEGRELWLGGIRLEHSKGLLGHSDADVLLHTVCDALLGAANMRDIGYHFRILPESTRISTARFFEKTVELIATKGYRVGNIDATICAERPKLKAHIPLMQERWQPSWESMRKISRSRQLRRRNSVLPDGKKAFPLMLLC